MRVLVTGVTGRIGRNLARVLIARGDHVRGLVLPDDPGLERATSDGVECVTGNLRDPATATAVVAGVDAIAHLGAMMLWGSDDHNPTLFEDNLRGTFNLANAAATTAPSLRRFVFASSDEVYPSLFARYQPIDESHPTYPYSFYGVTKLAGEQLLFYFHRANKLPVAIARFALTFEPWESVRPDGALGRFLFLKTMVGMVRARAGDETAARVAGLSNDDNALLLARDEAGVPYMFHCCDVRDLVQGLLLLIDQPAAVGEVFNLSGPAPFSYDQVIPYLAEQIGAPVVDTKIPGPPIRIHHSTAKARGLVGYTPTIDVFQSIADGAKMTRK